MKLPIKLPTKKADTETPEVAAPKKKSKKAKKPMTPKRIIKYVVLLALLGGSAFGLYQLFFVEAAAEALTEEITYGSLSSVLEGTATVAPTDTHSATFASNSDILGVFVSAGDTVTEGQLLYIQDDSGVDDDIYDYEQEILEQEESLDDYYDQLDELMERQAAVNVTASFAGKMIAVNVEEDDDVSTNTVLGVLVDDSIMTVTQYFSYAYEDDIQIGTTAYVSIPDQMLMLTGEVTAISYVDYVTAEGTHSFAVTISIPNPGSLTEGVSVTAYTTDSYGYNLYPVAESTLEYNQSTNLTAGTSAEVTGVYVETYQNVVSGQMLFSLDDDSLESDIETCYNRIESILNSIETLEEKIEDTEESREDYMVYSEVDGLVIMVLADEDRTPTSGGTSVVVYNMDTMEISANIDELDVDSVYMGMPVTVTYSSGGATQEYEASISEISYEATNSSGVAYFPVTIEINSLGALSSGVNVSYYITIGEEADGYLIPIDALKDTTEGTAVFVQGTPTDNALELADGVVPDGYYALPIEISAISTTYALVLEGLEEGMVVFTRYQETAPSGGDSTSDSGEEETTMVMPGMDSNMMMSSNMMSSGMSSGMTGGMGGR